MFEKGTAATGLAEQKTLRLSKGYSFMRSMHPKVQLRASDCW
jgi:hypothetical protein